MAGSRCCTSALAVCLGLFVLPLPSALSVWTGTDEEFVNKVEYDNYAYFLNNQGGPFMMFRGAGNNNETYSYDTKNTCAGDGFGIASLVVAAYRGWMNEEEAYDRIVKLLRSYDTQLARNGHNFYNHWYEFDTGTPTAEYSSIDSTWLICGALLAAQYFKGTEIDEIANRIYETTNFRDGYSPWSMGYTEYLIINIVGAGSPTYGYTHPADTVNCWNAKMTPYRYAPLFWYQWPQHFIDFRRTQDGLGLNHFTEAMNMTLEHRQKCIDLNNADPGRYNDYRTNCWGLTAAMASDGYLAMHPWTEYESDSGSVVPICIPASMSHAPSETRECMKYIYDNHAYAYGTYSFMNTFNNGQANSGSTFYWNNNASMDYGANVLAIENFRSAMPWRYFMSHPRIQIGMNLCGINTTTNLPWNDNFNDGADPNAWGGNTTVENSDGSDPTVTYQAIPYFNEWVRDYARKIVANGGGDKARFQLNQTDQGKWDEISFWMRGELGGEHFNIGLRDAENHEVTVCITNYVDGGTVSTNWTRIRIPLKRFIVSGSPNNDVRVSFLGDISFHMNATGTIYVEDLAFLADDIAPTPPSFGAACVDGRIQMRWGYSSHDDVVGYHLWRRPDRGSGYDRLNNDLLSATHAEIDPSVESEWGEDFFYCIQSIDRHGNFSAFSTDEYEQRVWVGRHRDLDWGDGQNPNTLGGDHGTWGSSWKDIRFQLQEDWDGQSNWVRVIEGDADCGTFIELNGANLTAYDALSFRLKQNWGANQFEVGLKSTNDVEVKAPIARYIAVTDSWASVVIPFIDFKGVDFTAMDNLSVFFQTPGSIFVDEIRFVRMDQEGSVVLLKEGEKTDAYNGGNTNDFKWFASEIYTLGNGWGANAGEYAQFNFTAPSQLNEAYLDIRYACGAAVGRVVDVKIDTVIRGTLNLPPTGGWGDEASHFQEQTFRLGIITNGAFTLELAVASSGDAVNLDRVLVRSASRYFREAEDCDAESGSGGADNKAAASGGEVLGNGWGGTAGSFAAYSNITISSVITSALLRVQYGQNGGNGRLLRVYLDGTNMGEIAFAVTKGWLDNCVDGTVTELPLGDVATGVHRLRLEAEGNDYAVNVDWIQLASRPASTKEYDTDGDGIPDSQEALYGTQSSQADSDGDGLSDLQEISRLLGCLTSPTNTNTDGDEFDDGEEITAGTNPADSNSTFEVVQHECWAAQGEPVVLLWQGSASASYDILYCDDGNWSLDGFQPVSNPGAITCSNSTVRYVDDGTGTTPPPNDPSVRHRMYYIRARTP